MLNPERLSHLFPLIAGHGQSVEPTWSDVDLTVIPTLHPAFALRQDPSYLSVIETDLDRAFRFANGARLIPDDVVVALPRDGESWHEVTNRVLDAVVRFDIGHQAEPIGIDTETTGLDPLTSYLRCIGLGQGAKRLALALPWNETINGPLRRAFHKVYDLISGPTPKVFHNAAFDLLVLRKHGFNIGGRIWDSLAASHLVDPDFSHKLGFAAHLHLDTDPWKIAFDQAEKAKEASLFDLLYYCARDALGCAKLWNSLLADVYDHGPDQPAILSFECRSVELAAEMRAWGIPVDEDVRRSLSQSLRDSKEAALGTIRSAYNWPEFKETKLKDRQRLLYDILKLPVRKYTSGGKLGQGQVQPSTSFRAVIEHIGNPMVKAMIQADEYRWLLSNVIDKIPKIIGDDGRVHPSWNVGGTDGSRWSSNPNFQNVSTRPVNARRVVKVRRDMKLIGADYAQLELRGLAAMSGAKFLIDLFRRGGDPHTEIAREWVGSAKWDTLDNSTRYQLRRLTKNVVYGTGYGAGSKKAYRVLSEDKRVDIETRALLTPELVDKIHKAFFRRNPEILHWRTRVDDYVNTTGFLEVGPMRRRRVFCCLPVEGPKAWNTVIQVGMSEFLVMGMLRVRELMRPGTKIILNGHDSMVVECREQDAEWTKGLVEWSMAGKVSGPAGTLDLPVEAKIGDSWDQV